MIPRSSSTSLDIAGSSEVSDIANSMCDDPVQPRQHRFPATLFGNKTRSFNPQWFDKHTWLEYSIKKDAAFCYVCRFFSTSTHGEESFVRTGYTDWKHAPGKSGKLEKHNTSSRHVHAMAAWRDYITVKSSNTSIASRLSSQRKEQISRNRHYIRSIIEVLVLCATSEIALRGHREVNSTHKGNFLKILDLVGKHDEVVASRLRDGPKNATYTSHDIQNELLHILAKNVRQVICMEVKNAGYYSIIVDESRDHAKREQMSFAVRYVNVSNGVVNERFLGFTHAKDLDAASLTGYIKEQITGFQFDLDKMVSQGYDGANVMSGHHSGVQTRVREFAPYAAYIHCHAHVLNLVLVNSVKSVPVAAEFFVLMEAIYVFFSASKAHDVFIDKQKHQYPHKQPMELQKLSDTRWVCRYAAINAICCTYDCVLLALEEIAESTDASKAVEARGLHCQVKLFSFLISLITFDRVLTCTKQLSDQLQSSTLDLSVASQLVAGTKSLLAEYRSPAYWKKVYGYAERIANSHDIPIRSSDQTKRRRKRPRHLEDSVILDTVGSRDSIDSNQSASDEICCQFFYPVLDMFITEMNSRFGSQNIIIMNGISSCTPGSTMFLSITDLKAFANEYAIDVRSLDVECSLIKVAMTHCEKEISSQGLST